ncbi:MAG: hypothetical protein AAGE52_37155 [Myxococcota bacterium]
MSGASAPGKMMISGEYAVLEGAPAIVAAVQTRATARFGGDGEVASTDRFPEAYASRVLAEEALGAVEGDLRIDVSALRRAGQKLGVGSSSAAAAAAAAAVLAHHDRDLEDEDVRRQALRFALDGHRKVAPRGSGADVAACTLGGFVRYRRAPGSWDVDADAVSWPAGLVARIAWTGQAASTHELITKVHALRDRDPATYRAAMARLREESDRFCAAFATVEATLEATRGYFAAMNHLGEAASAPIVEERLHRVARLAKEAGGAAKPSGAGGGDVSLALFASEDGAQAFERACRDASIEVLSLALGGPGVRAS